MQDEDGPGDDMASTRLRSRNDDECDGIPQPKAMPKPLAKQVSRRIAMDKAMDMQAERVMSGTEPSSSMSPPLLGIVNDYSYFLCSVPVANHACPWCTGCAGRLQVGSNHARHWT